jgi:hypothetical protein
LADPGLEPGRVEEKTREEMTRQTRQVDLATRLQPVDFCFFNKTTSFLFFKKKFTRTTQ